MGRKGSTYATYVISVKSYEDIINHGGLQTDYRHSCFFFFFFFCKKAKVL